MTARYLVNAGRMASTSWYLDEQLEGSRFLGEGGHFIDTIGWFVGQDPIEVSAVGTPEGAGLQVTLRYPDGSLAAIHYCTDGDPRVPKETFDVSGGGRNARLDNFARATVWAGASRDTKRSLTGQDKGQRAELDAFLDAVKLGAAMPIGLESLVATTRATDRRRREPRVGPSRGSVSRPARWYVQRLLRMSPQELLFRVGDRARQVRLGPAAGPAGRGLSGPSRGCFPHARFHSPLAPEVRAQVPPDARRAPVVAPPTACSPATGRCWAPVDPTSWTRTGSATRSPAGERRTPRWRSASTTGTRP